MLYQSDIEDKWSLFLTGFQHGDRSPEDRIGLTMLCGRQTIWYIYNVYIRKVIPRKQFHNAVSILHYIRRRGLYRHISSGFVWVQERRNIFFNNLCWLCLLLLMKLKAMSLCSTIGDLQVSMDQSLFFPLFSHTNKTTISNIFLGSFYIKQYESKPNSIYTLWFILSAEWAVDMVLSIWINTIIILYWHKSFHN